MSVPAPPVPSGALDAMPYPFPAISPPSSTHRSCFPSKGPSSCSRSHPELSLYQLYEPPIPPLSQSTAPALIPSSTFTGTSGGVEQDACSESRFTYHSLFESLPPHILVLTPTDSRTLNSGSAYTYSQSTCRIEGSRCDLQKCPIPKAAADVICNWQFDSSCESTFDSGAIRTEAKAIRNSRYC